MPSVTDTRTLPEIKGRINHLRKSVFRALDQAGPQFDLDRVTAFSGSREAKMDALRGADRELEDLQSLFEARLDLVGTRVSEPSTAAKRRAPNVGRMFVGSEAYKRRGSGRVGPAAELNVDARDFGAGRKSVVPMASPDFLDYNPTVATALAGSQPPTLAEAVPTLPWPHWRVRYLMELEATNTAAPVAEGDLAPEAALDLIDIDRKLKKVRATLPVTTDLLDDEDTAADYVNQRLSMFVMEALDEELLNGSGTGQDLQGFHGLDGIGSETYTAAGATPQTQIAAILAGAGGVANDGEAIADSVVISATDWWTFLAAQDNQGQFLFAPGQPVRSFFGLAPIVTTRQTTGRFLVGALQQHSLLATRPGVELAVSRQHNDFFAREQAMIRATLPSWLMILRPAAFNEITGV
jgi:hypothetical protein